MNRKRTYPWAFFVIASLIWGAGCSSTSGPTLPIVSPRNAARQALTEYDADKNSSLEAKELEACPALKSAMTRLDKNGDGRVNEDELVERFTFLSQQLPMGGLAVEATLNGSPLSGATVSLIPEKFMGESFKTASVVTDQNGSGILLIDGGVDIPNGYYRVEVSKKNAAGQETVPPRFNSKTTRGQEIGPDSDGGRGSSPTLRLSITSK